MMNYIIYFVLIPALLPVFLLLRYVYKLNPYEREPLLFVLKIFFFGALFTPIAIPLETFFNNFFAFLNIKENLIYEFIHVAVGVALIEEMVKWTVLKLFVWNNENFTKRYDGVVYAVASSLGFAAVENVKYVFNFGIEVSILRALLSIPGHGIFGLFMGYYYSRAKHSELKNHKLRKFYYLFNSILIPVLLHTTFDFLLSDIVINTYSLKYFIIYIFILDLFSIQILKHEFHTNRTL